MKESNHTESPTQNGHCAFGSENPNYQKHQTSHISKPQLSYKNCKDDFKVNTAKKPIRCQTCLKLFSSWSTFRVHNRIHTGEKPYKCQYCSKSFADHSSFYRHIRIHTGEKPYNCQHCPRSFPCKRALDIHTRTHTGEKPYQCEKCSKSFSQTTTLRIHTRIHTGEKPYKCEYCSKLFRHSSGLQRHILIHTGKRLFQCQTCLLLWSSKSDLEKHTTVHTGQKPYQCDYCKKAFNRRENLIRHLIRIHINENQTEDQKCDKSSKSSDLSSCKRNHTNKKNGVIKNESSHINQKPNKCKYCKKEFVHKIALDKQFCHCKEVVTIITYKCDYCDKVFAHQTYLHQHMLMHSADDKNVFEQECYVCLYCTIKLSSKSELLDHINRYCISPNL